MKPFSSPFWVVQGIFGVQCNVSGLDSIALQFAEPLHINGRLDPAVPVRAGGIADDVCWANPDCLIDTMATG